MEKNLQFLKVSSVIVKIAAWIFLFLGVVGGLSIIFGAVPDNPRWLGGIVLVIYAFMFFIFFLISKMAELLIQLTNETKKEWP